MNRRSLISTAGALGLAVAGAGLWWGTRPPSARPLRVRGNAIVVGDEPVRLRGVGVGDAVLARAGRPASDYRRIVEEWSANTVRLSLHPGVYRTDPSGAVDALARETRSALDADLAVIVDWHAIGWPDEYAQQADAAWDMPENVYDTSYDLAADFWQRVARRFGGEPRILFELWNEPVSGPEPWASPRSFAELKEPLAGLIALIRRHADNIVIASGDHWAYDLSTVAADRLADPNTAYAWHVYAEPARPNGDWARALGGLDEVAPVIVTEWGFCPSCAPHPGTAEDFGQPFVREMLEGRGLHSTAWVWHPDWQPAMLGDDWQTVTPYGAFVRDYLRGGASS